MKTRTTTWFMATLWLTMPASALAQLVAADDFYTALAGQTLVVEAPGVLDNDTLDGEDLPPTATAELLGGVSNGTLACPTVPAFSLCPDGSFDYTPDPGFLGDDLFTYRVVNGVDVSNQATVTLTVTACEGGPTVFTCWTELSYLAKLAELGRSSFQEGFEDNSTWGPSRQPNTVPSITSQEILWTSNHPANHITTGGGPARTGSWGFFSLPHGDQTGAPNDPLRDGFAGTWLGAEALFGVGAWLTSNTGGARVQFALDGAPAPGFIDPQLTGAHKFFGVIDAAGFTAFEIYETEGTLQDQELIFADDFSIGVSGEIFSDGFESGDTSAWTVTVGN